ncbi:hypothetical protein HID58_086338 [Brassica napus]|uniref:Uncharacterized protein n=1 Tax=Brassica napus TaxID=3708 RepID=A0ABQ7XQ68_BRANA|nr:hypothetical protein HID58_086338 [Brassica napus]
MIQRTIMHYVCERLFPFISATGNNDVVDSNDFYREDEKKDERIGRIVTLLNAKQDWTEFAWEVEALPPTVELSDSEKDEENVEFEDVTDTHAEEPTVVVRRGKRKLNDHGAKPRKKELLCQRAAEHNSGISSGMKTFIEGLFTSSFNSFKEVVQNDIQERFEKVQKEMVELKQAVSQIPGPSDTMGKDSASEIPCPSATMGKTKTNHHRVCVLQQQMKKAKARLMRVWFLLRFVVALGKEERICHNHLPMGSLHQKKKKWAPKSIYKTPWGTFLKYHMLKVSIPHKKMSDEEAPKWVTPLSSFKPGDWRTPTLKDMELPEDRVNDEDYSLVFVPEDSWAKLIH